MSRRATGAARVLRCAMGWCSGGCPAARRAGRGRRSARSRRAGHASTTPSSTPISTRPDARAAASVPAGAAPRPATCSPRRATWWRIQLDPDSRALDAQFSAEVERAIALDRGLDRARAQNAEAHFYAGAAYAARVQWRVLRDEKLAAARDGKRIKQALERAIALDPDARRRVFRDRPVPVLRRRRADGGQDAALPPAAARRRQDRGAGADAARARQRPAAARGRRTTSCRSSISGTSSAPTSPSSCSSRCTSATRAIRCSRPSSPTSRIATSTTSRRASRPGARCSRGGARAARQRGRRSPKRRRASASPASSTRSPRPIARSISCARVLDAKPAQPSGAIAAAYLALGEGEDRLGHHDAAVAAYRLAIAASPAPDPQAIRAACGRSHDAHARPRRAPRRTASRSKASASSSSGDAAGAEPLLARSGHARSEGRRRPLPLRARAAGEEATTPAALAAFDAAIRARARLPAADRRRRLPRRRAPARAARAPRRRRSTTTALASTLFGGGADTRAAANRALARLRARE